MSLDHAILGFVNERPRSGYDLKKWIDLITPAERIAKNVYRVGDDLALRFLEHETKQVLGITIKVRSLDRAVAYLEQQGLVGRVADGQVELSPARIHGLRIVLRE